MRGELTIEEISVLTGVVREYLTDLRTEILDTDDFTFRQELKRREQSLKGLLGKLEQLRVSALN